MKANEYILKRPLDKYKKNFNRDLLIVLLCLNTNLSYDKINKILFQLGYGNISRQRIEQIFRNVKDITVKDFLFNAPIPDEVHEVISMSPKTIEEEEERKKFINRTIFKDEDI